MAAACEIFRRFERSPGVAVSVLMKASTDAAAVTFAVAASSALQIAEPTTTPSANSPTCSTCFGVEIPKPTASGSDVC